MVDARSVEWCWKGEGKGKQKDGVQTKYSKLQCSVILSSSFECLAEELIVTS